MHNNEEEISQRLKEIDIAKLLNSDPNDLDLKLIDARHWIAEYAEISNNLRHANNMRSETVKYWMSLNSFLLLMVGFSLNMAPEKNAVGIFLAVCVSILGFVGAAAASVIEKRSYRYYEAFIRRGRAIELAIGFNGQYCQTYRTAAINTSDQEHNINAKTVLGTIFVCGMVFWFLVPTITIILFSQI